MQPYIIKRYGIYANSLTIYTRQGTYIKYAYPMPPLDGRMPIGY